MVESPTLTASHEPFATTQWTLVWRAASDESQYARPALEEIMRRYWLPLYSSARRRGLSNQDAEDATQEFLSGIIDGRLLESADPAKGRFRTYLLTAWKRFLIDQNRKATAQRRGGQFTSFAIDFNSGEEHCELLSRANPIQIEYSCEVGRAVCSMKLVVACEPTMYAAIVSRCSTLCNLG